MPAVIVDADDVRREGTSRTFYNVRLVINAPGWVVQRRVAVSEMAEVSLAFRSTP
jgi:hypothetical protein